MTDSILIPFRDYVWLESIDPARNRYRYFVLAWQPTLWGERVLVRVWGRTGTPGRIGVVADAPDAPVERTAARLIRRRLHHGYVVTAWR